MIKNNLLLLYWGRKGGGAKYSLELAKSLIDIDNKIHISISIDCEFRDQFIQLTNNIIFIKTYVNKIQFIIRSFLIPFNLLNFFLYVKKNNINVILCTMHHLWSPFVSKLSKYFGVKYILIVHDANIHPGDGGLIFQYLLDQDIKHAHKLISLSLNVKNQILSKSIYKNQDVHIFRHGPFFKAINSNLLPISNINNFLFFGRISKYKGLNLLIESWFLIKKEIPDAILKIYGNGYIDQNIKNIILSDSSIFLENRWIEEDEILELFSTSDICVLPYIESSQSGVIAISSTLGVPFVVTPEPGLIEQLNDFKGGIVSKSFQPIDFANTCIFLSKNIDFYQKLKMESLENAKNNSWSNIASGILNIIND